MPVEKWTTTQERRLRELNLDTAILNAEFSSIEERNKQFQQIEKRQIKILRSALSHFLNEDKKTQLQLLSERLCDVLFQQGFARVFTPTIITRKALEKMSITADHPLTKQVFWLNDTQCLRPMLAPNLYSLMQDFSRMQLSTGRFFEIGSCFRKESQGASHSNEFTMLNLVEMGVPEEDRLERLKEIARTVMKTTGITKYTFNNEESEVYGSTLDVLTHSGKLELASGAMGPHILDASWGVTGTWIGMGFGIERLLMATKSDNSIGRWTKNLSYLDGICLSI